MLTVNATVATIWLDSWGDGGCGISHFGIFYRYVGSYPDAYQLGTKKKNYFVYRTVKYNGSTTEEMIWDKTYEDIGVYVCNFTTYKMFNLYPNQL